MDKDRIEGGAREVKGLLKEALGKVTGNHATSDEGRAENAAGQAQTAAGKLKDAGKPKD